MLVWACAGPAQQLRSPGQPSRQNKRRRDAHETHLHQAPHNARQAMKSTYEGATVISEAQAFVAAAKARQDDGATKTSSLQALQILEDHDASALTSILGKSSVGSDCLYGGLVLTHREGAPRLALLVVFVSKVGLSFEVDGRAWTSRVPYRLLL